MAVGNSAEGKIKKGGAKTKAKKGKRPTGLAKPKDDATDGEFDFESLPDESGPRRAIATPEGRAAAESVLRTVAGGRDLYEPPPLTDDDVYTAQRARKTATALSGLPLTFGGVVAEVQGTGRSLDKTGSAGIEHDVVRAAAQSAQSMQTALELLLSQVKDTANLSEENIALRQTLDIVRGRNQDLSADNSRLRQERDGILEELMAYKAKVSAVMKAQLEADSYARGAEVHMPSAHASAKSFYGARDESRGHVTSGDVSPVRAPPPEQQPGSRPSSSGSLLERAKALDEEEQARKAAKAAKRGPVPPP